MNSIVKGEYKGGVLVFTREDGSITYVDLFHTTRIRTEILEKMITALRIIAQGDPVSVGMDEICEIAQVGVDAYEEHLEDQI